MKWVRIRPPRVLLRHPVLRPLFMEGAEDGTGPFGHAPLGNRERPQL
jgi:hypothetical protein